MRSVTDRIATAPLIAPSWPPSMTVRVGRSTWRSSLCPNRFPLKIPEHSTTTAANVNKLLAQCGA